MLSLYQALLAQHARQLTPVRCAEQTIAQLHHYFEDVVLENNLSALVVESLPFLAERNFRDLTRIQVIRKAASNSFFFSRNDALLNLKFEEDGQQSVMFELPSLNKLIGRFVVIADARFSAVLA